MLELDTWLYDSIAMVLVLIVIWERCHAWQFSSTLSSFFWYLVICVPRVSVCIRNPQTSRPIFQNRLYNVYGWEVGKGWCSIKSNRGMTLDPRVGILKDSENNTWFNPLNTNPTKWLNTIKQFVRKLPTNCLSVFDHFVGLAFKWLRAMTYRVLT